MFKVNTKRQYKYPVTVTIYDEDGKECTGTFKAVFKALPHDEIEAMGPGALLAPGVLVATEGLAIDDVEGNALEGEALRQAAYNDPAINAAIVGAYLESVAKKNRGRS